MKQGTGARIALLAATVGAGLAAAGRPVRADETWVLGDLVGPTGGGSAGDGADDGGSADDQPPSDTRGPGRTPGPLPDLGLPPEAGPEEYLAEFLRRCGAPTLEETMDAAVAFAGLDADAEGALVDQARWAALLPRLRVSVRRDWEHDESLDLEPDPADGRYGVDTDDDLELGVSAQWDLGALVAPPVATTARRLAREAAAARRALRLEVAATYFERCRLRLEWQAATDEVRRAETAWAIAERTARLDALTGGLFRRGAEAPPAETREGR
ncbi:MAG: hypothetical protein JXB32_21645 [Deltaproteobacteria bacterium]|nr:hypothetical protein [Deltaproteobacteria bacterium]